MKALKRIIKNFIWLLNHPPISIQHTTGKDFKCDYCGANFNIWRVDGIYSICERCRKKVFDKILLGDSK